MEKLCDACGLSMQKDGYSDGETTSVAISTTVDTPKTPPVIELRHYTVGKTYNVCWDCWLKSLGIPQER